MIEQETQHILLELMNLVEADISKIKDYTDLQAQFTMYFYPLWHRALYIQIDAACCLQFPVPQGSARVSGRRQLVSLTAPDMAPASHCPVSRTLMCRKVFYELAVQIFQTS